MNYATLLSAAHDYIYAYNDVRRTFPHGYCLWDSTLLHSEAAQKSICHDRYESVFRALCECTGIPQEVLIQAARIENRYYERGGAEWYVAPTAAEIAGLAQAAHDYVMLFA